MEQSTRIAASSDVEISDSCISSSIGRAGYVYTPFTQRYQLRVLALDPARLEDDIVGNLSIANIYDYVDYNAISYPWADENGDDSKSAEIYLGTMRAPLRVTRNCVSALRRVRDSQGTVRVWIDAVCIDQSNMQERNHQVNLMRLIYTYAAHTYVYLGESANESDLVLQNLARGNWVQPRLLEFLLRRRYFSRLWILQEIALSRHVTIICGTTKVPWSVFAPDNMMKIYTSSYSNYVAPPVFTLTWARDDLPHSLASLLNLGRKCQATNHKDNVFAVLGMIDNVVAGSHRFCADYSQSVEVVYVSAARYMVMVEGCGADALLGNLSNTSLLTKRSVEYCLPTWVPDWSHSGATFLDTYPETQNYLRQIHPQFSKVDGSAMFLDGFILGSLTELKNRLDWEFASEVIKTWHYYLYHRHNPSSQASNLLSQGIIAENVVVFQEWTRTKRYPESSLMPFIRFGPALDQDGNIVEHESDYVIVLERMETKISVDPSPVWHNLPARINDPDQSCKIMFTADTRSREGSSYVLDKGERRGMLDWVRREPFGPNVEAFKFLGLARIRELQVIVSDEPIEKHERRDGTCLQRIRII